MPNRATTIATMVGPCASLILKHDLDQRPLNTPSGYSLATASLCCSDFINTLGAPLPPFPELPRATTLALMVSIRTLTPPIWTGAIICRSAINWYPIASYLLCSPPSPPWLHHLGHSSIYQPRLCWSLTRAPWLLSMTQESNRLLIW